MNKKIALFETYVKENKESHYRFVLGYVKNEQDALDVIQDSIVKAMTKIDHLKDIQSMKAWFYQILSRTAIDFLRKNKKVVYAEFDFIESQMPSHEDVYENFDLINALERLPAEYKTIVHLRFYESFKIDEISEILNVNLSTVKTRLYAALKRLRLDLQEGDLYE